MEHIAATWPSIGEEEPRPRENGKTRSARFFQGRLTCPTELLSTVSPLTQRSSLHALAALCAGLSREPHPLCAPHTQCRLRLCALSACLYTLDCVVSDRLCVQPVGDLYRAAYAPPIHHADAPMMPPPPHLASSFLKPPPGGYTPNCGYA